MRRKYTGADAQRVLSTTTVPPFITHCTLSSTTLMSASGSPSTATMSAKYPGAIRPSVFSMPRTSAPFVVAVASACAGVMPSLHEPSELARVLAEHVNTASDPMPIFTPALNARRAVSKLRKPERVERGDLLRRVAEVLRVLGVVAVVIDRRDVERPATRHLGERRVVEIDRVLERVRAGAHGVASALRAVRMNRDALAERVRGVDGRLHLLEA